MNNNHSILWNDATLDQDRAIISFLVQKIVAGKNLGGHHETCIDKILNKIQTKEWQSAYPQRTYVFSVFYGLSLPNVIEIQFALHAQALELMYFNIASTNSDMVLDTELSFSQKLRQVFRYIYKWDMPSSTANAIRILRNDVMHTGTIAGVLEAYINPRDPNDLERFFTEFGFNKSQLKTNVQNRMQLAHSFNYLIQDALIRTLGLDQNDLSYNSSPAWRPDIFGYNHDSRPDWLRE